MQNFSFILFNWSRSFLVSILICYNEFMMFSKMFLFDIMVFFTNLSLHLNFSVGMLAFLTGLFLSHLLHIIGDDKVTKIIIFIPV